VDDVTPEQEWYAMRALSYRNLLQAIDYRSIHHVDEGAHLSGPYRILEDPRVLLGATREATKGHLAELLRDRHVGDEPIEG
jgi:hypothetical protein